MATISTFANRILLLNALISVNPTVEELKRRLDEGWPSHLAAEKEQLHEVTCHAIAAESIQQWDLASHQFHYCLGRILMTNKSAIPQELLLWLVKRICVPLAFISQFRLRNFKLAFKALDFMFDFVWFEYNYGDTGLNVWQERLKSCVETMMAAVLYDAREDAKEVNSEYYHRLSQEDVQGGDLKARCCEHLCVQYYILGQIGDVWWWHGQWKSSITCITDTKKKEFQERDCLLLEASLYAEYGTDDKKAEGMMVALEKVSQSLDEDDIDDVSRVSVHHVISKLRLVRSGDKESRNLARADVTTIEICLGDELFENHPLLVLNRNVQKAMNSARHEDAIGYLQEMIDHVKYNPLYTDNLMKFASAMGELLYNQASCHQRLFQQKELKFFIDYMKSNCSHDENVTSYTSMSLKLCAHHCWDPYCQHESHDCPDEEEDLEADEEGHQLESATDFFRKRHMESDGNNLIHLDTASELLTKALDYAQKAGSDIFYVAKVQSVLARTYLLIAENKCLHLVGYESRPLPVQITLCFLDSNNCHTIQQVQDFLKHKGTSTPEESFHWALYHYRQCAQMFTTHLESLKEYSEKWIHSIELQKDLYVNMQHTLSQALDYYAKLRKVILKSNISREGDLVASESEFVTIAANIIPEALLWSERGRARFLEFQLIRKQPEIFPLVEPSRKDLSTFHLHDKVAWDAIRSSLDACGQGTVFLEYVFDGKTDLTCHAKTLGRVYAVKKASGKIMEPLLRELLPGDPTELQFLVRHLHNALKSDQYEDAEVIRDLEKLYVLLITPDVAKFLNEMKMESEHKLVICPSQIFTEVPFAALRNPNEPSISKGYLFQSHTISITPSLRILKYNKERYMALEAMELMEGEGVSVAIGDPRYKDSKVNSRLEQSGVEVESIASLFPNRCAQVKYWEATVENLLKWAKLPTERSRSQAFVHIAAHCETGKEGFEQGKLMLTELDHTDHTPSSSTTVVSTSDGILSAEDIVTSKMEWRTRMIVLSACGSGKGEVKAEGVLNLPRAFMVAGVPCSVVSQWNVEDGSTAELMKFFYQRLLKGVDVATALRSSMQQMLDQGKYTLVKQWAPFMVWGLPTVCLPTELLSKDAGAVLLQTGKELHASQRYSDALLPLRRSLEFMKANKDHTDADALVWCLWWLADCEEDGFSLAQSNLNDHQSMPIGFPERLKFAYKHQREALESVQFGHLASVIRYLNEALDHAKDGGFSMDPPTLLVVHKRLGQIHHRRAILYVQKQDALLLPDKIDGIQAVLDVYRAQDISAEDSLRKAFEHCIEHAKLCSHDMQHSTMDSEPWDCAANLCNEALLDMRRILCWRRAYLQHVKQHLVNRHKRPTSCGEESQALLSYTQEFQSLVSSRAEKEMWLSRIYTPEWDLQSLGKQTVAIDDATWDLLKTDSWKDTRTLEGSCGVDVVVEYVLDISQSSQKFLLICVMSQVRPPRLFVVEVNGDVLYTASMMPAHNNLQSSSFLKNLELLHEILIKPVLEDPMVKTMHHEQKLVFIPCECLEGVPFALLRDGAQLDGEGYLFQSHTISVVPSLRLLEHCSQCLQDLQRSPLMPGSDASLVLSNPANPTETIEAGDVGPEMIVSSEFPTHFKALLSSDATVESLLEWAQLPSSLMKEHCQAFFHLEAEIVENYGMNTSLRLMLSANLQAIINGAKAGNMEQSSSRGSGSRQNNLKLSSEPIENCEFQWRVHMAALRACEAANGQMQKKDVLNLARAFLVKGVPCVVISNCLVDDVSSHFFFSYLYTSLKDGEDVATAVCYSMLEMKNDGFQLDQWGAFSVFGAPTARLPQEMLSSTAEQPS